MPGRLWRRIVANLRRSSVERELDAEIEYHLDRETMRLIGEGLDASAARAEARKAFGGIEASKEASRDARGLRLIHEIEQDTRYAARLLRRQPALAVTIASTIALAIAGTTTLFSIVYGVLLKPLPFPNADRLVVISEESRTRPRMPVSYPDYLDWRARTHVFDDIGADLVIGGILTGGGEPTRVFGRAVTRSFFSTLQVAFALGRPFTAEEDRPGGAHVAILGNSLWRRRYGGDSAIVGQTILYNDDPYVVVGVLPADFEYYGRANANNDLFLPLGQDADEHYMVARDTRPLHVTARLRAGTTVAQASAEMTAVAAALANEHRETNADVGVRVRTLLDDYVGDVRRMLVLLLASAAVVLGIACANIANLLLARMASRQAERAMRLAVGASTGRLVRQFMTEVLVIVLLGGIAGLCLTAWAIAALPHAAADVLPRMADVTLNGRVALFAFAVTLVAAAACAIGPAVAGQRAHLRHSLGARGVTRGGRMRDAFVFGQIASSVILITAAGLLVRSFDELRRVDPGYVAAQVVTMRVRLPDAKYAQRAQVLGFLDALLSRVSAVPHVESACLTTAVPLGRTNEERFALRGQPLVPGVQQPVALTQWVTADYYRTFGIPLIAGRYFSPADREGAGDVAIVDEEFAKRYATSGNAAAIIGSDVRIIAEGDRWREIVGVVRHVRHRGLDEEPRPEIYAPYAQMEPGWQVELGRAMDLAVRGADAPDAIVSAVRSELRALDPDLPLSHVQKLTDAVAASIAPRAFAAAVLGAFATVALLLSALGIYGIMSYSVTQQTPELGVRLALGARREHVLRLVLRRAAAVVATGSIVGILSAFAASRLLDTLLYNVTPRDPFTYALGAIVLGAVALIAAWLPARRALRVDPLIALRQP